MASPAVLLYEVLVKEYESQGIEPPYPRAEEDAAFERLRRPQLDKDLAALRAADARAYECKLDTERVKGFYSWLHQHCPRRAALCFSGGGIRSATFGLGLVQGLARKRMLGCWEFLSTVSGGGYLGSWLSAWIYRERQPSRPPLPRRPARDPGQALAAVESALRDRPASPLAPGPEPLGYLRSYSRYMSPRLGLLSADTWTLVAVFVRNLLLNWLVLLPLLAAMLVVPRVSVILVRLGARPWFQPHAERAMQSVFWAAVVLGSCAIAYIIANRPSLREQGTLDRRWRSQKWFLACCLLPLALMSILITLYWAWLRSHGTPLDRLRFVVLAWKVSPFWGFILFGVLLHLGGFLLSRLWVRQPQVKALLGELVVAVLTGALGGGAAWVAAASLFPAVGPGLSTELYVCFAAPLLLFLFLLAAFLFVGVSSWFTTDADREWQARCGAWILIFIAVRMSLAAIVIFGPVALLAAVGWVSSIGGVSGLVTLLLGRSAKTKATRDQEAGQDRTSRLLDRLLVFAAPLFAVFILILLALGTTVLIQRLIATYDPGQAWPPVPGLAGHQAWWWPLSVVYFSPWVPVIAVLALLLAVGLVMGWFVDINRFSLHAAYRDRLIRAYLGASRGSARRPNPFTGFDDDDNVELHQTQGNRPLHVVGMTLNLVAGKDLAWQDRKAEGFTATPLHVGSFRLGYRPAAEYARHVTQASPLEPGQDRGKTGALSLGTVMAISGAAASPNMGASSSPVVTFLLALFNIRLGWWLGNPGPPGDKTYTSPGPRPAPLPLFAEAFGLTDAEHRYVYLSDGGHFENLGLYEMVLRRCHFILVSDGSQDPKFAYEDLGNAVSKIRVDLGVPIRFEKILIPRPQAQDEGQPPSREEQAYDVGRHRKAAHSTAPYCALARICYSCVDSVEEGRGAVKDGILLYVKPSLNGTEPADVFHYARLHPEFPHESTANQLYSEAQFESYRELGSHVMATILENVPEGAGVQAFFRQIEAELGKPPGCD